MRSFMLAAAAVVLLIMPAYSQGMSGGRRHQAPEQKTQEKKLRINEKAYKSALDKIPTREQKPDPWQNVRQPPKPK